MTAADLKVLSAAVEIGLPEPLRLLHITDTHVNLPGPGNPTEEAYTENFAAAIEYAKAQDLFVVHTGDLTVYNTPENYAFAKRMLSEVDHICIIGNHDLTLPGKVGHNDPVMGAKVLPEVQAYFEHDLTFSSRIVGGVNFVSLNNIHYRIKPWQVERLQAEAKRGYPIILLLHIPLFDSEEAKIMADKGRKCPHMLTPPEQYRAVYGEHTWARQCADADTLDAVRYIGSEPAIRAIFAGHLHERHDGICDCGKRQIITNGVFQGYVREIMVY
ncbi:MAG: metallophosphoesterase [Clostridia bacterium]|nr:metallophosphoesterase [Clostridia bacterium]